MAYDGEFSADAVEERRAVLFESMRPEYREEISAFAEAISNGAHGIEEDNIISYEEAILMQMIPDALRPTCCSALSLWGSKTTTGDRITLRNLEWNLGSNNQMGMINAVTHMKNGNRTLCVYSLGNFMAMQADDYNMLGGMVSFDIVKRGDEHASIENVLFTPTVYYFAQNWYGSRVYFLSDFTEAQAASHGIGNYGNRLSIDTLKYYLNSTIDNEYLPEEFKK